MTAEKEPLVLFAGKGVEKVKLYFLMGKCKYNLLLKKDEKSLGFETLLLKLSEARGRWC